VAQIYQFPLTPLLPAHSPNLAVRRGVNLPFGGPVGVGGPFGSGLVLARIGGAKANQVMSLTVTLNSATGFQGYFTYYADTVYSGQFATGGITANAVTGFPSTAQMQAALVAAVPQWSGNVAVTGGTGATPYTITFNSLLANQRIGGLLQFNISAYTAGSGPTAAITYSTKGSCGTGQWDVYSSSTFDNASAFLGRSYKLDPAGGEVLEFGSTGQPRAPWAYTEGFFSPSQLIGLDANAMTLGNIGFEQGVTGDLTNPGCIVRLTAA
jgi:hypothetical protein